MILCGSGYLSAVCYHDTQYN